MNVKTDKRRYSAAVFAAGGIAVFLWLYFCFMTVYSSDDYWYSTFWNNGLMEYLKLMVYHYQTMNGRVLVHVLAHTILYLGNWAFAIMCLTCCIAAPAWTADSLGIPRKRIPVMVIFFLYGMLLMPQQILNQGVFWISASCNYLFPSALICMLAIALEKKWKWSWIAAFLCGATTEQMGLTSVFLCGIYLLDALIRKERKLVYWTGTAAAVLGVLSVFASPATSERASEGVRLDGFAEAFSTLQMGILREKAILTENPLPILVMLLLLAAMTFAVWEKCRKSGIWGAAAVAGAALLAGSYGPERICWIGYTIAFLIMAALAVCLVALKHRLLGALVLAGLFAAAVMLPTNSVDPRVMTPTCYLFLLCICLYGADRFSPEKRFSVALLACSAVAILCLIPDVKGYAHNYQIDRFNQQLIDEAKETNFIRYCTDYDGNYTWIKADHDPYFRIMYLVSNGFPEDESVIFFSQSDTYPHTLYFKDELLNDGVLTDAQERVLLPLRQIVTTLGGEIEWEEGVTKVRLDQVECMVKDLDENTMRVSWVDEHGELQQQDFAVCTYYTHKKYCEISFFTQVLNIPVELDQERFCYFITD